MRERCADRQFAARLHQTTPRLIITRGPQQKAFNVSAGRPLRMQTRWNHRGDVSKQGVTGPQKLREIGKRSVFQRMRGAIDHEESRRITTLRGSLRD